MSLNLLKERGKYKKCPSWFAAMTCMVERSGIQGHNCWLKTEHKPGMSVAEREHHVAMDHKAAQPFAFIMDVQLFGP